ncbi:MAG TPA: histidine phosphatase family protein [Gemmatimonadaceae bacterium]|nr:histidine phosphatase family protein [Gemmatimonadaceae bacterium]
MQLLVVRHAIAEDREEFARGGRDDSLRPLTREGRRKMRRAARGLRRVVPSIDVLATSPYARAEQTAWIVADAYGGRPEPLRVGELVPDAKPAAFVRWLRSLGPSVRAGDRTVAVVGHEPHLGELVTWLLAARGPSLIELKKGGACLLRLDDAAPGAGSATLRWALAPSHLRRLGA